MKFFAIILMITWVSTALFYSCSTPGPVTGRPDPNVSTSGTLGSVKATERPANLPVAPRDTMRRDTLH